MNRPDDETLIHEVLEVNERLLQSITTGDWETYQELCDPTLTAFEPECRGALVEGLEFHGFYFDRGGIKTPHNTTVCAPHVRLIDDVAVLCYVRLLQVADETGKCSTFRSEETRVWQRHKQGWRHVHFHRSVTG